MECASPSKKMRVVCEDEEENSEKTPKNLVIMESHNSSVYSEDDRPHPHVDHELIHLVRSLHQTIKELSTENAELKKRLAVIEFDKEHNKRLRQIDQKVKSFVDFEGSFTGNETIYNHHIDFEGNSSDEEIKRSISALKNKKVPICKYDFVHDMLLSQEDLDIAESCRSRSVSHKNFAKNLLQEMYKEKKHELEGKNTRGKRGKSPLPRRDVEVIKTLVWKYYPDIMLSPEGETEWEYCVAAIDEFLRRKKIPDHSMVN